MTCCKQYKWARRAEATRHEMILIEITVKGHVMWSQLLFSFKGKVCLFSPPPPPTYSQPIRVDIHPNLAGPLRCCHEDGWPVQFWARCGDLWIFTVSPFISEAERTSASSWASFLEGHASCVLEALRLWRKRNRSFLALALTRYNCLFSAFLRLWIVS